MDTSASIPLSALAAFGVVLALILLVAGFRKNDRMRIFLVTTGLLILPPSVFLVLALNLWITDPRFRAFRSFYYDVEEGMTRAEVLSLLNQSYPDGGERGRPIPWRDDPWSLSYFLNTKGQGPSCEGVNINFDDGRVIAKGYSND